MAKLIGVLILALLAWSPFASADELRKDGSGYFVDKDEDDTRDTDGTEPFVDFGVLEVPGDYSTVQGALDSNDVKKGNTASQGADIRLAPGTYGESFEIGGNIAADYQNSIRIRGAGPGGLENSVGTDSCATTLIGDNTASNTVIKVDGSIGWGIADLCIDMDDAGTNDPAIGIHIGGRSDGTPPESDPAKHGIVENVTIHGGTSGSIGIKMGNDAENSDTAFNVIRNYNASQLGTALVINAEQTVGNLVDGIKCRNPLGTIGCVSIGTEGGEVEIRDLYMSSGAADQIGIDVRNEAVGATLIIRPTFEWDEERGSMIRFWGGSPETSTGAARAITILGGRFQPQIAPNGDRYCINFDRVGTLHVVGANFESSDDTYTCKIRLNNPHATRPLYVTIDNVITKFGSEPEEMLFDRSTDGGPLVVTVINNGTVLTCTGTGAGESLTLANPDCVGISATAVNVPTASAGDNDTSAASTAFVTTAVNAKSAASSTDNAVPKFDSTAGDVQNSGVLIDDSNNLTVPGSITSGTSGASCLILRDSDDGGDSACEVLNGTFSCETDTNGVCGDAT